MPNLETSAESRPQFRLRQAALAFGAAAIVLAIAAPWLREFNAAQWLELGNFGLAILFGWLLALLFIRRFDRRSFQRNGATLLDVGDKRSLRYGRLVLLSSTLLLMVFGIQMAQRVMQLGKETTTASTAEMVMQFLAMTGISFQILFGFGLVRSTRFCEHGISIGTTFIAWEDIKSCRWSSVHPQQLLIGSQTEQLPPINIQPELREQVEAILRTHATGFIQSNKTSHSED